MFPSLREGLPVSVMEAMAAGLPVIATNIRGNKDLIKHGWGGYLVESDQYLEMGELIKKISADTETVNAMAKYNIDEVQKYEIKRVSEKVIGVYMKYLTT